MDEVNETEAQTPVRRRRPVAMAVMLAVVGLFVFLAVEVHFLWLMGAPVSLGGVYGAWLGLSNDEMLGATSSAMPGDATGANPF